MRECVACSAELGNFEDVRESVVAWRNESLGGTVSPALAAPSPIVEKRSALAALRQFFNLSPLWMKGSLAFASILFFLLAGLAIARLRETPPPVVAADRGPSEEQINARVQRQVHDEVERRLQEEIERFKNSSQSQPNSNIVSSKAAGNPPLRTATQASVAGNNPTEKARRPLSKVEREQLAADLRLTTAKNESELDLLDDGINQ
jgi:hypothetical protein